MLLFELFIKVKNINEILSGDELKIINVNLDFNKAFKVDESSASKFINKTLDLAHKYGLKNNVSGIINCPINKNLLNKGIAGVTEDLAFKCGIKNKSEVMLIRNKKISVSPITTHINVKDVSKQIKKEIIIIKIKTINKWFKKFFKKKPKIAILSIDPHAGDGGVISKNDQEVTVPVIKEMNENGFLVYGPFSSDSFFGSLEYKKYDITVASFHDQGLIPFKTLSFGRGVNYSSGLERIRTSPDHGTAYGIAGKGQASKDSFLTSIFLAIDIYKMRKIHDEYSKDKL